MIQILSIILLFLDFTSLFNYYINWCDGITLEDPYINKILSDSRLNVGEDVFNSLRTYFISYKKLNYENSVSIHYSKYYRWLLSIPNLSPNSVIYNEEPSEADQSHSYENNYLNKPKFVPVFYKIDFNDYYDHVYIHIRSSLDKVTPRTIFSVFKDKLNGLFDLPKFVIEAISSHTTSFDEIFRVEMIGDNVELEDCYSRSLLLFLDYHFFKPLLTKAFVFKFSNKITTLYRLRFSMYCKIFSKKFKRYKTLVSDKQYMLQLTDLTNYFDIAKRKLYPFIPLPYVEDNDKHVELPLDFTSVSGDFYHLIQNIVKGLKKAKCVDFIFHLLDSYSMNLYKINDLSTIPVLGGFYILEVTPRSFGYSFYNIFPPEERNQIINYKDSFLVSSHLCRLDSDHRVIQIINKFLISVPFMVISIVLVFVYVVKFVQ